jgi:predicted lipoprotein with Yx(FWY)xxD motif
MQSQVVVMKKDAKLGSIAADAKGMTLYVFDNDTPGKSNCSGQCAVLWPPYVAVGTAPANLPTGVTLIKRADGSMQYADNGKALYTYTKDKDSGDTYGDGVGGVWHVVK